MLEYFLALHKEQADSILKRLEELKIKSRLELETIQTPMVLNDQLRDIIMVNLRFKLKDVDVIQDTLKDRLNIPNLINEAFGEVITCEPNPIILVPYLHIAGYVIPPSCFKAPTVRYINLEDENG